MSLTIKAYLHEKTWVSNPVEIRRFTIDQDVSSSYAYLLEKVVQVFPSVKSDNIVLAWTDSDGDIVTISSDEELVEALDQFEGNIFRLYLRRTPRSRPQQSGEEGRSADSEGQQQEQSGDSTSHEGTYHPGVICDSCNGSIYGIRYKCLVCHDYDLCSLCEGKGVHMDHNMVSIPKPHPWGPWHPHGGFGGPFRGWGRGCRGRGGRGRFGGGGQRGGRPYPCGGGGQGFIPPWFQGFGQGGPNCWGTAAKPGENPENSKGEGEAQEPMDTEQKPAPSEDDRRTFLQGVGEAVSNFLEPFGVKVDVDVVGEGGQKAGAAKTTTDAANAETEVPAEVVEEALTQLKSMGYQDEGGWLVELVKAKGGDITKVLDALHPSVEQD